ncbi:MAG: AsmA-like C-terminal region-containing protein [Candidatus Sumerlaeia bacterium]
MSSGKPSLFKRIKRHLFAHFLVISAILIIIALVVLFVPFKSTLLSNNIKSILLEATGLEVDFEEATFYLARGKIAISDIRIGLPDGGEITDLKDFGMKWDWQWLKPSQFIQISSIRIVSADKPVICYMDDEYHLQPNEPLQNLLDFLQGLENSEGRPAKVLPQAIPIEVTNLSFFLDMPEDRLTTGSQNTNPETGMRIAGLEAVNLEMQFDGRSVLPLHVSGRIWGRKSIPFEAQLVSERKSDSKDSAYSINFDTKGLHLADQFQKELGIDLRGRQMAIRVKMSREPLRDEYRLEMQLDATSLQTELTALNKSLPKTDLSLDARLLYDAEKRIAKLENVEIDAFDSEIIAAAQYHLNTPHDFVIEILDSSLTPHAVDIASRLFPENYPQMEMNLGKANFRCRIPGRNGEMLWDHSSGEIAIANIMVQKAPYISTAQKLGPLALEAEWTTRSLEISRFRLESGVNSIGLSTKIHRSNDQSTQSLPLQGNWNFELDAEKVLDQLPTNMHAAVNDWKMMGNVQGVGTLQGWMPENLLSLESIRNAWADRQKAAQYLQILQSFQFNGFVQFRDGAFQHPVMPVPLDTITGSLFLENNVLRFSSMSAHILGSPVTLSGDMKGRNFFWQESRLDLAMVGSVDLQNTLQLTGPMLEPGIKKQLRDLEPQGLLNFDVKLLGELKKPESFELTGNLSARNMGMRLALGEETRRLENQNLDLELNLPRKIAIKSGEGTFDNIQHQYSGSLTDTGIDFQYQLSGNLERIESMIPMFDKWFNTSGPFSAQGRFSAERKNGKSSDSKSISEFIDLIRREWQSADKLAPRLTSLNEILKWDFRVDLQAKGNEFTMVYMPARVRNINGDFIVDKRGLRTDGPIDALWGQSRAATEGVVTLTPDLSYKITFSAFFPEGVIDEWVQPWGPGKPNREKWKGKEIKNIAPEDMDDLPYIGFIDGTIRANKATFKDMQLQNLESHFTYRDVYPNQGYLDFDSLEAEMYGGKGKMSTWLYFYGPFFRWNTDGQINDANCGPLLEDIYKSKSTVTGNLSGKASIGGIKSNLDTYEQSGAGSFSLKDSRFLGNPLFLALGKLTGSKTLENISFTEMKGEFIFEDDIFHFPRIAFKGPVMQLAAVGDVNARGKMDMMVTYAFANIDIPFINLIPRTIESLTSAFIKARVQGTLEDPKVSLVPFSSDKIPGLGGNSGLRNLPESEKATGKTDDSDKAKDD